MTALSEHIDAIIQRFHLDFGTFTSLTKRKFLTKLKIRPPSNHLRLFSGQRYFGSAINSSKSNIRNNIRVHHKQSCWNWLSLLLLQLTVLFILVGYNQKGGGVRAASSSECLPCSDPDWFLCENCLCVPTEKVCDGVVDCRPHDWSDEKGCPVEIYNATCGASEFQFPCHDTSHIRRILNEGENSKEGLKKLSHLVKGSGCIREFFICDGAFNCPNGEEEDDAICSCPDGWFHCLQSNKCIPEELRCNGVDDCGDGGSDEEQCLCKGVKNLCSSIVKNSPDFLGCGTFQTCNSIHPCFPFLPSHESKSFCDSTSELYASACMEQKGYSKCFDDKGLMRCIERHLLCDGIPQCMDAADENDCPGVNRLNTLPEGYETDYAKEDSCVGACDHICAQKESEVSEEKECSCLTGFSLSTVDKFSCIAKDNSRYDQARLFAIGGSLAALKLPSEKTELNVGGSNLAGGNHLFKPNPDPEHSRTYLEGLSSSSPLAMHVEKSLLYFVDETRENIVRYNVVSMKTELTINIGKIIGGIAVDWIHNLLFWTESTQGAIVVSSLDGIKNQTLYTDLNYPTCIVAVPNKGALMVCERPFIKGRIIQLAMNGDKGSLRELISGSDSRWADLLPETAAGNNLFEKFSPTSLAYDYVKDLLYFCDNHFSIVAVLDIESQRADTSFFDMFLLTTELQFANQKLFGIEIFNNRLYISETRSKIVYEMYPLSARMNPSYPAPIMTGSSINLSLPNSHSMDLKVFHKSRQPIREEFNHCEKLCSYLCLPTYKSYKCICPKGYRLVMDTECELIIDPFLIAANSEGIFKIALPLANSPSATKLVTASSFNERSSNFPSAYSRIPEGPADIDWHPVTNRIYWTDPSTRSIQSINYDGSEHSVLVDGLEEPYGLAVDYITEKIYFTDVKLHSISTIDLDPKNRRRIETVLWADIFLPSYVAIDFQQGYLYWACSSRPFRLERSRMDGSGRGTVITKSMVGDDYQPSKIVLSLLPEHFLFTTGEKIVDLVSGSDQGVSLEKVCCNGRIDASAIFDYFNHSIITTNMSTITQCAINLSSFHISTSDKLRQPNSSATLDKQTCQTFKPHIKISNAQDQSNSEGKTRSISNIKALSVFHQGRPRRSGHFCSDEEGNPICEHSCSLPPANISDPAWSRSPLCTCAFGYEPNPENRTRCIIRRSDVLLISSGKKMEVVYFNSEGVVQYPQIAPVKPAAPFSLWHYDPLSRSVVYFDSDNVCLIQAEIATGKVVRKFLKSYSTKAFALDHVHQLIFFVANWGYIQLCQVQFCDEPRYVRTLVSANLTEPRSLLVDPNLGLLFWDDIKQVPVAASSKFIHNKSFDVHEVITQIDMSGDPNSRRVLLDVCVTCDIDANEFKDLRNIFRPLLTIDLQKQTIVFTNEGEVLNTVKYFSSEVRAWPKVDQTVSFKDIGNRVSETGMACLDGLIYFIESATDRNIQIVKHGLITGFGNSPMYEKMEEPVSRLAAYSHVKKITDQCADIQCSYICVPTYTGEPRCLCPPGVWLSADGVTCEGEPRQFIITPNSLLLPEVTNSNPYHSTKSPTKGVTQFTCQSANYADKIGSPVAIDFHYKQKFVFVATNDKIYRFDFNLNNPTVIQEFPDRPSYILGLAVDWIADNLYWLTIDGMFVSRLEKDSPPIKLKDFKASNGIGALAVHPRRSFVFWSHPALSDGIYKSYMDVDMVSHFWNDKSNPDHMTIDYENNHIYWLMRDASKLFFSDLEGHNIQTLDQLFQKPLALAVLGNITYCMDLRPSTANSAPHVTLKQCNLNSLFNPMLQPTQNSLLDRLSSSDNRSSDFYEELLGPNLNMSSLSRLSLNDSFYGSVGGTGFAETLDPTCSSVDACKMNFQSASFTALTFVSPLQQTGLMKDSRVHPCAVNNGGCGFVCLATQSGRKCKCPNLTVFCHSGETYLPPNVLEPSEDLPRVPPATLGPAMHAPDFQEQIQMVLIIVVCAAAIVILLIVSVIVCIRKYYPQTLPPDHYHPHPSAQNNYIHHTHKVSTGAHFSPGGAIVNPRIPLMGTLRASTPYIAMVPPPGTTPRMPGATAVVHHNAFNGTVYHSLPRRSHCSLAPDNYVMPQNSRRYSTHSLQRNSRFALHQQQQSLPHNYIELQSHQFSIPTGPAGQNSNSNQSASNSIGGSTATYVWTPSHMTKTLSNKNLNKATLNHYQQQIQQQHNVSHSPTASYSSQGSRNTVNSGTPTILASSAQQPLVMMAQVIPFQALPSYAAAGLTPAATLRRGSGALGGMEMLHRGGNVLGSSSNSGMMSTPKTRSSVSSVKTDNMECDWKEEGGVVGRGANTTTNHYSQLSQLSNSMSPSQQSVSKTTNNKTNTTTANKMVQQKSEESSLT